MKTIVAPSILSADFSNLKEEIEKVGVCGARFIHLDVMDGKFVPNKTFGPDLVASISPFCVGLVKDTHLMIVNPVEQVDAFADAGSDIITFHYEAVDGIEGAKRVIDKIHGRGIKAGISIKPATSPEVILPLLPMLDLVLVMSVEPGKGGQSFLENALDKIAYLRTEINRIGRNIYLEVDGGINEKTGRLCVEKGANVLVAGSYIYGHDDYVDRIRGLLEE